MAGHRHKGSLRELRDRLKVGLYTPDEPEVKKRARQVKTSPSATPVTSTTASPAGKMKNLQKELEQLKQENKKLQAEQLIREEMERLRIENRQLLQENTSLQCKLVEQKTSLQCKLTKVNTLAKEQLKQKNKEIKQLKLKLERYRKLYASTTAASAPVLFSSSPDESTTTTTQDPESTEDSDASSIGEDDDGETSELETEDTDENKKVAQVNTKVQSGPKHGSQKAQDIARKDSDSSEEEDEAESQTQSAQLNKKLLGGPKRSSPKAQDTTQKASLGSDSGDSTEESEGKVVQHARRRTFNHNQARKRVLSSDSASESNGHTNSSQSDAENSDNVPLSQLSKSSTMVTRNQRQNVGSKSNTVQNKRRKLELSEILPKAKDEVKLIEDAAKVDDNDAPLSEKLKPVVSNEDSIFSDEGGDGILGKDVNVKQAAITAEKTPSENVQSELIIADEAPSGSPDVQTEDVLNSDGKATNNALHSEPTSTHEIPSGKSVPCSERDGVANNDSKTEPEGNPSDFAAFATAVPEDLLLDVSPAADETLPSDLTSSSDKLVINEDASPILTPSASPCLATSSPAVSQGKTDIYANIPGLDYDTPGGGKFNVDTTVSDAVESTADRLKETNNRKQSTGENTRATLGEDTNKPNKVSEKVSTSRRSSKDTRESEVTRKVCRETRSKGIGKKTSDKTKVSGSVKTDANAPISDKSKTGPMQLRCKSSQEEEGTKANAYQTSKASTKNKVVESKVKMQSLSKSVRTYMEIYSSSSSDEYSSDEEDGAVQSHESQQKVAPEGKDLVATEKSAKTKMSKVDAADKKPKQKLKKEVKNTSAALKDVKRQSSATKNETKQAKVPNKGSKTDVAKPAAPTVEPMKKVSLGSYKIPKRKNTEKAVQDKPEEKPVVDKPSTPTSTPKAGLLTTTQISPLHMTSTCDLSPGMMNLLSTMPHGRNNVTPKAGFAGPSPGSTTRGQVGPSGRIDGVEANKSAASSLTDLLTSCKAVFSSGKSDTGANQKANISDRPTATAKLTPPPEVTRILDTTEGKSSCTSSHQSTKSANLPPVLTGLLSKTTPSSGAAHTSSQTSPSPSLPPALASLLTAATAKPAAQEKTSSIGLPQPLAKLIQPIAGNTASNNESTCLLPPELARLLPPGVRSISPTPVQCTTKFQKNAQDNTSRVSVTKKSSPAAVSDLESKASHSQSDIQGHDEEAEGQGQTKGEEKISSVRPPQLSFGRKREPRVGSQWSTEERKKPVVPEKKGVTHKGLSDEERLIAYINCGDRNNIEQRKSRRVDRHEMRQMKKVKRKEKQNIENIMDDKNEADVTDYANINLSAKDDSGSQDDVETDTEVVQGQVELSRVDKRSQELNMSIEQDDALPQCVPESIGEREQLSTDENNEEMTQNTEMKHAESLKDVVSYPVAHQDENRGSVQMKNADSHTVQRSSYKRLKDSAVEGRGIIVEKNRKNSAASSRCASRQSSIESLNECHPPNEEQANSHTRISHRRSSTTTTKDSHAIVTPDGGQKVGANQLHVPAVRRRSSSHADGYRIAADKTKNTSLINLLPPPSVLPDHMILPIPLENSRNGFNVHHHDIDYDPRMKKCLDSESIYSAGYEYCNVLILPRYTQIPVKPQTVGGAPVGAPGDPRLGKVRNKADLQEDAIQAKKLSEKSDLTADNQSIIRQQKSGQLVEKQTNKLLHPEDLVPAQVPESSTEHIKSVANCMAVPPISRVKEYCGCPVSDENISEPKSDEAKMKKTVEKVLINTPVDQAQFKTVEKTSSFGTSGRESPEAKLIDPKLIRRVLSVRKPTPMHRVVVGPPVISAITTRHPVIKSPTKSRQAAMKEVQNKVHMKVVQLEDDSVSEADTEPGSAEPIVPCVGATPPTVKPILLQPLSYLNTRKPFDEDDDKENGQRRKRVPIVEPADLATVSTSPGSVDCAVIPLVMSRSDSAPVDPRVLHVKQNVVMSPSKSRKTVLGERNMAPSPEKMCKATMQENSASCNNTSGLSVAKTLPDPTTNTQPQKQGAHDSLNSNSPVVMEHFGDKLTAQDRSTPKSDKAKRNVLTEKPNLHDSSREMIVASNAATPVLRPSSTVYHQGEILSSSEDSMNIHEKFDKMFQSVEKVAAPSHMSDETSCSSLLNTSQPSEDSVMIVGDRFEEMLGKAKEILDSSHEDQKTPVHGGPGGLRLVDVKVEAHIDTDDTCDTTLQNEKLPFSDITNDSLATDTPSKSRHVPSKPDISLDHIEQTSTSGFSVCSNRTRPERDQHKAEVTSVELFGECSYSDSVSNSVQRSEVKSGDNKTAATNMEKDADIKEGLQQESAKKGGSTESDGSHPLATFTTKLAFLTQKSPPQFTKPTSTGSFMAHRFAAKYGNDYIEEGARSSEGDEFSSALSADEEEGSGSISLPFSTKSLTVNYKFAQMCLAKHRPERQRRAHDEAKPENHATPQAGVGNSAVQQTGGENSDTHKARAENTATQQAVVENSAGQQAGVENQEMHQESAENSTGFVSAVKNVSKAPNSPTDQKMSQNAHYTQDTDTGVSEELDTGHSADNTEVVTTQSTRITQHTVEKLLQQPQQNKTEEIPAAQGGVTKVHNTRKCSATTSGAKIAELASPGSQENAQQNASEVSSAADGNVSKVRDKAALLATISTMLRSKETVGLQEERVGEVIAALNGDDSRVAGFLAAISSVLDSNAAESGSESGSSDSESGSDSEDDDESGSETGTGAESGTDSESDTSDSEEESETEATVSTADETENAERCENPTESKVRCDVTSNDSNGERRTENKNTEDVTAAGQNQVEIHREKMEKGGTSASSENCDKIEEVITSDEISGCISKETVIGAVNRFKDRRGDKCAGLKTIAAKEAVENVAEAKCEEVTENPETEETQSESEGSNAEDEDDDNDEGEEEDDDGSDDDTDGDSEADSDDDGESENGSDNNGNHNDAPPAAGQENDKTCNGNSDDIVSTGYGNDRNGNARGEIPKENMDKWANKSATEDNIESVLACGDSQSSTVHTVKSGSADSASSELSLSEFVTLDALEEDSLFSGIDESSFTVEEKKKGRKSGCQESATMTLRSSPRKRPSTQRSREFDRGSRSSQTKSSRSSRRRSENRLPSQERRGINTPTHTTRTEKTPVKKKHRSDNVGNSAEINGTTSSAQTVNSDSVLEECATSLEEGEIEDGLDSPCEARRSPRKHPSSRRQREIVGKDSSISRGSVKRRLASPPARAKRARHGPERKRDSPRSSRSRSSDLLSHEDRKSTRSPGHRRIDRDIVIESGDRDFCRNVDQRDSSDRARSSRSGSGVRDKRDKPSRQDKESSRKR